jgi:hypothetical protein
MILAHGMHALARVAVAFARPTAAFRIVRRVGRWLPPLTAAQAQHVAGTIEPSGSCLTRAVSISARLPGSEVVIGRSGPSNEFHAWVEVGGRPLRSWDVTGPILARLTAGVE